MSPEQATWLFRHVSGGYHRTNAFETSERKKKVRLWSLHKLASRVGKSELVLKIIYRKIKILKFSTDVLWVLASVWNASGRLTCSFGNNNLCIPAVRQQVQLFFVAAENIQPIEEKKTFRRPKKTDFTKASDVFFFMSHGTSNYLIGMQKYHILNVWSRTRFRVWSKCAIRQKSLRRFLKNLPLVDKL